MRSPDVWFELSVILRMLFGKILNLPITLKDYNSEKRFLTGFDW